VFRAPVAASNAAAIAPAASPHLNSAAAPVFCRRSVRPSRWCRSRVRDRLEHDTPRAAPHAFSVTSIRGAKSGLVESAPPAKAQPLQAPARSRQSVRPPMSIVLFEPVSRQAKPPISSPLNGRASHRRDANASAIVQAVAARSAATADGEPHPACSSHCFAPSVGQPPCSAIAPLMPSSSAEAVVMWPRWPRAEIPPFHTAGIGSCRRQGASPASRFEGCPCRTTAPARRPLSRVGRQSAVQRSSSSTRYWRRRAFHRHRALGPNLASASLQACRASSLLSAAAPPADNSPQRRRAPHCRDQQNCHEHQLRNERRVGENMARIASVW